MTRPRILAAPVLVVLVVLLASCGSAPRASTAVRRSAASAPSAAQRAGSVRVVAAGDIACAPGMAATPDTCQQDATAALARRLGPDLVLTLGDHQYESNSLAEFQGSYARSWGALLARTRPTIGNHEYLTPGARGYYTYFRNRQPGPPGYYRVKAGAWQVFVLNSNCGRIRCGREATWLDRQLKAHPSRCSMITMHHPRFSSGSVHGNNTKVIPLWQVAYKHRADLVLSGHEHDYERFNRMDPAGHVVPKRGLMEIVVGTGGANHDHLGTRKYGSAYFLATRFGVLQLDLRPTSYSWAFRGVRGRVLDSGSRTCL